jgi:hypothetical protein
MSTVERVSPNNRLQGTHPRSGAALNPSVSCVY